MGGVIRLSKLFYEINLKKKIDPLAFKTTVSELNILIPGFDWEKYILNDLFEKTFNMNVSRNQTVIIDDLEYLQKLVKIINYESKFHEDDFDNFLIWELIDSLNDIIEPSKNELLICSNYVFKNFNVLLSKFLLKDNFESENVLKVEELIKYLRNEFKNLIYQSSWMDEKSKRFSIERINSLKFKIGYPKYIFNDSLISNEYLKYNFSNSNRSFFQNEIFRRFFNLKDNFAYLNKERNENIWLLGPSIPNAAFSVLTHEIYVPAGIIQTPIFDPDNLMLFNFARLGFIIAHEMA
ncbi:endothelin-converting enzyme-like 1, partial [Brachionus plicatilis]